MSSSIFSSTSSASTSREPTPSMSSKKEQKAKPKQTFILKKIVFSLFTQIIVLLFTFIVALGYLYPVYYCDTDVFDPDCVKCPVNAICSKGKKQCIDSAKEFKGVCIAPDSDEEVAYNLIDELDQLIQENNIKTLEEIKAMKKYQEIKSDVLMQAIEFSDKYSIVRGKIVKSMKPLSYRALIGTFFCILIVLNIFIAYERMYIKKNN
ncbi:hypothetical protein GPJ56_008026 [Histomonas meleagridis]|uniref:uncharacterized protein n=1 Tax=Histomonas meleagridis TaxID=135588 RepID=UPI003559FF38|nr:hypothetical protein GPJ56_008026 [Histomonas meleagridis]KAH0804898.1 hypothetical protein GO595_002291 [Histomonas meleagridis]